MTLGDLGSAETTNAGKVLDVLCRGLVDEAVPKDCWSIVEEVDIPVAYRGLLVHNEHMTTRLASYHGQSVALRALASGLDGDVYRRKIILTVADGKHAVEFGLVRINLSLVPELVRSEIIDRKSPLGDILIRHDVLRRIVPRWYLKIAAECTMFQDMLRPRRTHLYGRIGTIYCKAQPAIELLEVVTDLRSDQLA